MDQQSLQYAVDLVFCIDATSSMAPRIEQTKAHATRLGDDIIAALVKEGKHVDRLRARTIVFRDLYDGAAEPIEQSPFYEIPSQQDELAAFISNITAIGGGDPPENALEALALAIRSDWVWTADKCRHLIILWTDNSAHRLEDAANRPAPFGYPPDMPTSLAELRALWDGQEISRTGRRLLIYAPDLYPWNELSDVDSDWECIAHMPSIAGAGLTEIHHEEMVASIAKSV